MTTTTAPVLTPSARARSRGFHLDELVFIGRSLRRLPRQYDVMIVSVALPVMLLLMFVYVFGAAIDSGGRHDYLTYVVPGIIVLAAGWGATGTAVWVASDMTNGIIERFRSMPTRGSAVLAGHVVASMVANAVATALVIGLAIAIGFRPTAGAAEWLAAVGLVALYVLALTWVSVALGLLAGGPESANGITFVLLFLPYVSSGFVPTATMPAALRAFADHQPLTPVIDTMRGLLVGGGVDGHTALVAVLWSIGILVVGYGASAALFRARSGARG